MEKVIYAGIQVSFEDVTIHPHFRTAIPTLGICTQCHMHHWDKVTQWYQKNDFPITWDGHFAYISGVRLNEFTEIPYSESFGIKIRTIYNHIGHLDGLIITTEPSTVPRSPMIRTYDKHEPTGSQVNVREFKK